MRTLDLHKKFYSPRLRLERDGDLNIVIDTDRANWIGVNDLGARVLQSADGHTYEELLAEFAKECGDKEKFAVRLTKYLEKCHRRGFLSNEKWNGSEYEGRGGLIGINSLDEMWIITNFDCNLRCRHCYTMDRVKSERDMLDSDEIKKIVDDARELGVNTFYFTGGEPFMRKDILDLVAYVTSRSKLILFTNGTLLTKDIVDELAKHRERLVVQISMEGHNEEFNSKIRNRGSFEKALNGIKMLLEKGIVVGVSSTPITATKDSVPRLTEMLGRLNVNGNSVKYHHLIYLICFGNALKYPFTTLSSDELNEVFDSCCKAKKDLKKQKINKTLKITNEKIFQAYATNGPKKDLCGAGYTILAVDTKGRLYPCASTISNPEYDAGSLLDGDGKYIKGRLKELWHGSKKLDEVRNFSIKRKEGEPEADLRFFHGGGCWCNMNDPSGAFSTEHFFAETYEKKTLEAIKKAAKDDIDDDEIKNKFPKIYSYMSRERIACAGIRKTLDKSEDGLDLGYCICFS